MGPSPCGLPGQILLKCLKAVRRTLGLYFYVGNIYSAYFQKRMELADSKGFMIRLFIEKCKWKAL